MTLRDERFHGRCNEILDFEASIVRHGGALPGAEMPDGAEMRWHMLHCYSPVTAAAGLMARRFGVYLPTLAELVVTRGRRRVTQPLMFEGLLFLCIRSIEAQRARILSVPGVSGIVRWLSGPAVVLPDVVIDKLQGIEMRKLFETGLVRDVGEIARPSKQARRRRRRQERDGHQGGEVQILISPLGTKFDEEIVAAATAARPQERTALFRRAMRLDDLGRAMGLTATNESVLTAARNGD